MRAKLINEDINKLFKGKSEEEINQRFQTITKNPNIIKTVDNILVSLKHDILKSISSSEISEINYSFQSAKDDMLANILNTLISETLGIKIKRGFGSYNSYWYSNSSIHSSSSSRNVIGIAKFENGYELKIALNSTSNSVIAALFKNKQIYESTTSSKFFHTAIQKISKLLKENNL